MICFIVTHFMVFIFPENEATFKCRNPVVRRIRVEGAAWRWEGG
jgi:hypothetical protein